jgi:hypothetical protein
LYRPPPLPPPPLFPYVSSVDGTPALHSLTTLRSQQRMETYPHQPRSPSSARFYPAPQSGRDTSPLIPARAACLATAPPSSLSFLNRLVWDKHLHGGNLHKNADPELHPHPCPLCGNPDSLRHWTLECTHPDILSLRTQLMTAIRRTIFSIKPEP